MTDVSMRVDHLLLAVRDLDAATRDYRDRLGLNAVVGGAHPGRGTHNSLVHFGSAYLELIAVQDAQASSQGGPRAAALARFVEDGDAPYTFALAVDDLDAATSEFRQRGLEVDEARDGSRRTPEGVLLRWRSADLRPGKGGPSADAPPLPFLIQWESDEAGQGWFKDRVALGKHPAGWGTAHAMLVATEDPAGLADEYERLFGWIRHGEPTADQVALEMPQGAPVNAALGPAPLVVLLRPAAAGGEARRLLSEAAAARLERHGAGLLGLAVRTRKLDDVAEAVRVRGATVVRGDGRWAVVDPRDAHGLALELVG